MLGAFCPSTKPGKDIDAMAPPVFLIKLRRLMDENVISHLYVMKNEKVQVHSSACAAMVTVCPNLGDSQFEVQKG